MSARGQSSEYSGDTIIDLEPIYAADLVNDGSQRPDKRLDTSNVEPRVRYHPHRPCSPAMQQRAPNGGREANLDGEAVLLNITEECRTSSIEKVDKNTHYGEESPPNKDTKHGEDISRGPVVDDVDKTLREDRGRFIHKADQEAIDWQLCTYHHVRPAPVFGEKGNQISNGCRLLPQRACSLYPFLGMAYLAACLCAALVYCFEAQQAAHHEERAGMCPKVTLTTMLISIEVYAAIMGWLYYNNRHDRRQDIAFCVGLAAGILSGLLAGLQLRRIIFQILPAQMIVSSLVSTIWIGYPQWFREDPAAL